MFAFIMMFDIAIMGPCFCWVFWHSHRLHCTLVISWKHHIQAQCRVPNNYTLGLGVSSSISLGGGGKHSPQEDMLQKKGSGRRGLNLKIQLLAEFCHPLCARDRVIWNSLTPVKSLKVYVSNQRHKLKTQGAECQGPGLHSRVQTNLFTRLNGNAHSDFVNVIPSLVLALQTPIYLKKKRKENRKGKKKVIQKKIQCRNTWDYFV